MINHAAKKIPADAILAVQNYIQSGGTINRVEPKTTKKADIWALRLRMLHGSKGHSYVR
jgi:hypothetical protein